ncbi:FAD-dependent oxidoreductase [Adlercreutzia sp. R21]|uniref:FAD-dependent oxidoreductase n=1 Tax=Adlercreutzia wanghongyangiae TaxID=3111451 RepID=UPI002DB9FD9A|nr:FAD-dependent oxidoreductase [Adlercreutzia sp. R21]MEC4184153.1 FAD-dependent oxidoreductase [Adlercreutzia sp. R21]
MATILNRRDFIAGGAIAGATALLATATGCAPKAPEPITDIAEVRDFDVIVIGAGIAGINAAQAAASDGATVAVIEQSDQWTAHGSDIGAIGSSYQKAEGIEIDAPKIVNELVQYGHSWVSGNLINIWARRSGEMMDEVIAIGNEAGVETTASKGEETRTEVEAYYKQYPTSHSFGTGSITDDVWPTGQILRPIVKKAEAQGAEFVYNTHAEQLVQETDGTVTGVVVTAEDGSFVQYNAAKAVILATGDIGGNEEMLEAWCPRFLRTMPTMYNPIEGNMGDGLKMGLWAGGKTQEGPAAMMVHAAGPNSPLQPTTIGWMQFNAHGKRFYNETPSNVATTNAMVAQPLHKSWYLFDGDFRDKVLAMIPENEDNFGPLVGEDIDSVLDKAIEGGFLFRGESLEDLAAQLDVPADTLKASVERYNELCSKGVDEDFSKDPRWLEHTSVEKTPFYAGVVPFGAFVCIFGLSVNDECQVLREDGTAIPGLYAIGNVQGDFFAGDYPLLCPGLSHGRAMTFGRLVGHSVAQGEQI